MQLQEVFDLFALLEANLIQIHLIIGHPDTRILMRKAATIIGFVVVFWAGLVMGGYLGHSREYPGPGEYPASGPAPAEVWLIKDKIGKTVRNGGDHFQLSNKSGRMTADYLIKPIATQDCKDYGAYEVKDFGQETEKVSEYPLEASIVCMPKPAIPNK